MATIKTWRDNFRNTSLAGRCSRNSVFKWNLGCETNKLYFYFTEVTDSDFFPSPKMAQQPVDLKMFAEAKQLLSQANDDAGPKKAGSFTYFQFPMPPKNAMDEVYPGVWLGDAGCAQKLDVLKLMEITHVVNVSMGTKFNQTNTSEVYYAPQGITFHGIPAMDIITFKLYPYFRPAADFMDEALANNGKIYIHCQQGVSRSAAIVLAFLMLKRDMDLVSAVKLVRQKREIFPNEGFLKQLCQLQSELKKSANHL